MRYLLIGIVRMYQFFISPYFPSSCRYYPTCSHYAIDALKTHGVLKGLGYTAWRILRCNPWSEGGEDPVPGKKVCCDNKMHATEGSDPNDTLSSGSLRRTVSSSSTAP
jgi:putative membrane protein insertion efficiency factor